MLASVSRATPRALGTLVSIITLSFHCGQEWNVAEVCTEKTEGSGLVEVHGTCKKMGQFNGTNLQVQI